MQDKAAHSQQSSLEKTQILDVEDGVVFTQDHDQTDHEGLHEAPTIYSSLLPSSQTLDEQRLTESSNNNHPSTSSYEHLTQSSNQSCVKLYGLDGEHSLHEYMGLYKPITEKGAQEEHRVYRHDDPNIAVCLWYFDGAWRVGEEGQCGGDECVLTNADADGVECASWKVP